MDFLIAILLGVVQGVTEFLPVSLITSGWSSHFPGASASFVESKGGKAIAVELGSVKDQEGSKLAEEVIIRFLSGLGIIEEKRIFFREKKLLKIKKVYKNLRLPFSKLREFEDFEELEGDCIIGKEGNKIINGKLGDIVLFVRDREKIDMECFILLSNI